MEPLQLAGLRVELDQRVRVEVRPRPARPGGELGGAGVGRRVAGAEVHEALLVEGRWVPDAAAGVDRLVAPEAVGHSVEVPQFLAGLGVERPEDPDAAAFVERSGVQRHGRDVDHPVVVAGRHVDALAFVARQDRRPELLARLLVERERFRRCRAEDPAGRDGDAVRSLVGLAVVLRPEDFARVEAERLHVGGEILRVDHALVDHRSRGVAAEVAGAGNRRGPGAGETCHVGAAYPARRVARVRRVDAGIAGAGEVRAASAGT